MQTTLYLKKITLHNKSKTETLILLILHQLFRSLELHMELLKHVYHQSLAKTVKLQIRTRNYTNYKPPDTVIKQFRLP